MCAKEMIVMDGVQEEKKEKTIRERIEWLLDLIQEEDKNEKKMRTIYALMSKVYAGVKY